VAARASLGGGGGESCLETVCLREHAFAERVAAALPEPVIDYVRLNIVARR
jgi:hypothetical protein